MLYWCFLQFFCNGATSLQYGNMGNRIQLQNIQVLNLHLKSYLVITFWAIFLLIIFEDLILIFHIWVHNTTIEGAMKNIQFKQYFATSVWPYNDGFSVLEHIFLYTWPCLLPFSYL